MKYTAAVSGTVVVVSDAHLRAAQAPEAVAFHAFLERVPDLASHLIVNGDLFEFWFEYRHVIPRDAFPVLAALDRLRRSGVALTVTGGNHDRWGGPFWRDQLGAAFHPGSVRLALGGYRALVAHGDGLTDPHRRARLFHWLTRRRAAVALFRWLHPDVSLPLVDAFSRRLADRTRAPAVLDAAAEAQRAWARGLLDAEPDLALVVLGHTHRAVLEEVTPGRWYLNSGAWIADRAYAVIGPDGPRLCRFTAASR